MKELITRIHYTKEGWEIPVKYTVEELVRLEEVLSRVRKTNGKRGTCK